MKKKVLVIVGPTASGKSALGVELAREFNGEVISADSRQVYRGLDIGTGKITKKEMRGVPHHLLDVASPKKAFSAGDFVRLATRAFSNVSRPNDRRRPVGRVQKTRVPIVVGGTGFYIDALVGRATLPEVPPNPRLRTQLAKKTAPQLFALLKTEDAARAKAMNSPSERNNKVRLIRAIEIALALGKVPQGAAAESAYDVLWIGLRPHAKTLERKISARLIARIKAGMIAEARRLHANGLSYKRMEELGLEYRSLARYLHGDITKDEMVEELKRDIRRYAKKQMAYWARNTDIKWFAPGEKAKIRSVVRTWLT